MNAPRTHKFPPSSVARNVGEVAHNVITLGELQLNLLGLDVKEWLERSKRSLVMLATGSLIALGAIPVALATLAFALHDLANLPLSVSFLITTLTGFLLAGVLGGLGYRKLCRAPNVFERSQSELSRNVAWIKHSFRAHSDDDGAFPSRP